ncbi:S-DNA-T family DNA segregation ATPase FtsK/SpoIIIE [Methylobacterium fujisawaense]|uniref:S-DNA-T family DNA segregation ATPase FtsK/SpoIIIE n=2 Tax=Methylobacterium fujisawaense TaxID=107400 RepID=A0ABR6DFV2_9HYPH|nr:S-DNA-T family DNA segregation ATPase FtsK/SpoIIIE [Methylobacterium fujisawaense]
MRASGRPPYSHRDPARPVRGGDRSGLSLGALAHRLMALRASLTRRLSGSPAGLPARPSYGAPGRRAEPSWLTPPGAMVGREAAERAPRAAAPEPHWPDQVFDDRASLDALDAPAFESRIDRSASSPGVLVRQPRRPAAIAPEGVPAGAPVAAPVQAAAPSAVRYTRTPDSVLQERRQRALEAERVALERARAEAQAAALALETERAAREEAERERIAHEQTAAEAAERVAVMPVPPEAAAPDAEPVPLWRQPFVAPPGVRFFRTPDRRPVRPAVELAASTAVIAPVAAAPFVAESVETVAEAPARDWSDLPDWSEVQPWFDGGDWSSVEAWSALEAQSAEAPPAPEAVAAPAASDERFVSMPLDISHLRSLPPRPVYVLDRLVRFDQPPRPADGQDNGTDSGPRTEEAAAIRSAFLPPAAAPASGLSLVFGPGSAAAEPPAAPVSEAPRRAPALSAMAARAAIRAAGQPSTLPPAPPAQPEAVPAPVAAAPAAARAEAERVVIPMTPRPVLLRGKLAPQPEPVEAEVESEAEPVADEPSEPVAALPAPAPVAVPLVAPRAHLIPAGRHLEIAPIENADYELPSLELLALPAPGGSEEVDADVLEQNALNLQQTVQDFGVRGDILAVRPGPVVTLYELEPAPGTKSSRVIGLSDDIARSMSAVSARVAVVPGRNVIGIELPNETRETVYLRELLSSADFAESKHKLALCLGKNIGGEPIIADLARMPHLLVAGTTGSGKSVAINTMILSLLYRLKPEECRLIMVDPKMLELSVYDGIPHLLSPVVIDPKKAVIALKWAVREMEERYKKMAKIAVRNIDGYNARMKEARDKGETITRTIQTGFDRHTGEAVFEEEAMDLAPLPYIVIVVDEMADLMMVAGKDIEGAIQRLAQMARAAGIHLIMATQRPSVDVITGTIKANFPTRISFQVTSKIDSRTILGEMGAEQLLGQGDMLFMAGGGRTTRVHGPFCSDSEVETVVAHLKRQGRPSYLDAVTADDSPEEPAKEGGRSGRGKAAAADKAERGDEPEEEAPVFDIGAFAAATGGESDDLYKQAIEVVLRDQKASTSYIQRRLQIGYNRAASIMERMEIEGIVGPANHAGKREILVAGAAHMSSGVYDDE